MPGELSAFLAELQDVPLPGEIGLLPARSFRRAASIVSTLSLGGLDLGPRLERGRAHGFGFAVEPDVAVRVDQDARAGPHIRRCNAACCAAVIRASRAKLITR